MTILTANEHLQDALIRHQIGLLRHSSAIQARILELLNATERDLVEAIERRGRRLAGRGVQDSVTKVRLQRLLEEVREIRGRAMSQAFAHWRKSLQDLVRAEAEHVARIVRTVAPVQLEMVSPDPSTLRAIVTTNPFEGQLLAGWAKRLARNDLTRIMGQVQIGMVQGDTPAQMARRIVGTAQLRGANGVTEITRREASTITRTAVQTMANASRQQVYDANSDLFTHERFVATLDSRTTPICRANDGKQYKRGEGPHPPLHFNCRSVRVPVIDPRQMGIRPARTATQRQLLREYARQNGLEGIRSRTDLPRGHAGKFDAFSRRRVRELTGTVPASTTYQEFLSRQSSAFQRDVLGATRARLFRQGGISVDRFVDRAGRQYTLAELARREAAAFRRAGLDPDDFT